MKHYKAYLSFFRLNLINHLQYRLPALAGMCTQFAWGGLEVLVFTAFYKTNPSAFPMSLQATTCYIWLKEALLGMLMASRIEGANLEAIMSGNIAYELCRPISIYNMWFAKNFAYRLSDTILRCGVLVVIAILLPKPYGLTGPASLAAFLWFLLSVTLGACVVVSIVMLIYMFAFFTISPAGLRMVYISGADFLSGGVIPIPFFPDHIRTIIEFLPFASIQNVPLRIYSGDLYGIAMYKAVLLQIFWIVVLIAYGKYLGRRAQSKLQVQGG